MNKAYNYQKNNVGRKAEDSITPKGIHHTVSYAKSFNDTWAHIRQELSSTYEKVNLRQGVTY